MAQVRATERIFDVVGIVRAPLEGGRIAIAHQDIPGFMPAMTMRFAVAEPDEAAPLKVGDRVQFRLHVDELASKATDFVVTGRETTDAATPASGARLPRLSEGDPLPDLLLTTDEHQSLTAGSFRGRLTVLTFMFTRCPVPEYCPAMALRFGQLQRAILGDPNLASRAQLLSITLDPEFDRPEVLRAYGEAVGANPRVWQFATGSASQVSALAKAFSVYAERNGVTLEHTLCTALVDDQGRVREIWRGNGWHVDDVIAALSSPR